MWASVRGFRGALGIVGGGRGVCVADVATEEVSGGQLVNLAFLDSRNKKGTFV